MSSNKNWIVLEGITYMPVDDHLQEKERLINKYADMAEKYCAKIEAEISSAQNAMTVDCDVDIYPSAYTETDFCVKQIGSEWKDNRKMMIPVSGNALEVGAKVTISGVTVASYNLDTRKFDIDSGIPMRFTVVESSLGRVILSPMAVTDSGRRNCFGKIVKGAEITECR